MSKSKRDDKAQRKLIPQTLPVSNPVEHISPLHQISEKSVSTPRRDGRPLLIHQLMTRRRPRE